jgi:hypothetical protein
MSPLLRPALATCALLVPVSVFALVAGFSAPGCGNGSYIQVPVYEGGSQDTAPPSLDAPVDAPSDAPSEATDAPTDAPADGAGDAPSDGPSDAAEDSPDVGPG